MREDRKRIIDLITVVERMEELYNTQRREIRL